MIEASNSESWEVDLSELHLISGDRSGAIADVLFVHGLGGDPFATWWHDPDRPHDSWPFWLADELPQVAVHCLAYDASPSKWLGSSMPLVDRATNVLTLLEARAIGDRPLFFICHSLGGLVVKQVLRSALELGEDAWRKIAESTRGIVFLATPHTGARLADYLGALSKILRLSVSVHELEASAPALRDLNVWYRQKAQNLEIDTLALFETRNTHGLRVVDEASADAGRGVPRAIDADHATICKPGARGDLLCAMTEVFLTRHVPTAAPPEPHLESPTEARRVFISYSRRAEDDARLAKDLQAGLEGEGHDVFIDTGMRVGTDWVQEIEQRIAWCDYLVVLLSEASVHSEMVLGEVRMAHRKRRRDGRPHILPIRVRYSGTLDYELDSYMARVQYLNWRGPADSPVVVKEILAVTWLGSQQEVAEAPAIFEQPHRPEDRGRPAPSEDLRLLYPAPGGTIRPSDDFYLQRPADRLVETMATRKGETLTIKAPRQFGKSSLLIRYLARCSEAGKRFALIDFQTFTDVQLDEYGVLLTELAKHLVRGFRLELPEPPEIQNQSDLSAFIEDAILAQLDGPVTFAFDEVDRVLGRSYQSDFFSMLRLWHNRRAEPLSQWERVDIALVIATEPYLLIDSKDRSPFNVAIAVEPDSFDRTALDDLNGRYGGVLSPDELDDLHELVAGHPFLTRLAFYRIVTGQSPSFAALHDAAAEPDGPFGDHLRAMLVLLQHQEGLLSAVRQVVRHRSVPEDELYYRLHGAGLARREGGRVVPSNLLYARFFRNLG